MDDETDLCRWRHPHLHYQQHKIDDASSEAHMRMWWGHSEIMRTAYNELKDLQLVYGWRFSHSLSCRFDAFGFALFQACITEKSEMFGEWCKMVYIYSSFLFEIYIHQFIFQIKSDSWSFVCAQWMFVIDTSYCLNGPAVFRYCDGRVDFDIQFWQPN